MLCKECYYWKLNVEVMCDGVCRGLSVQYDSGADGEFLVAHLLALKVIFDR